ncbi:MAG: DNA adenine methylase [Bdellovibrionales bacterium]|jgi:adenine-specific DNA-methyltransferase
MFDLFTKEDTYIPLTEGIKYAGSKLKIIPNILKVIRPLNVDLVLDGFSGTTRVSQAFAQDGYSVIANDRAIWSEVFAACYLENTHSRNHYKPFIDHLNNLPPEDGWFTQHYGGEPSDNLSIGVDGFKKPWQVHNTRRLDAIRGEISRLNISEVERAVLITSLIHALDEVDSTMGHFASYLNAWSSRSYKKMILTVPRLLAPQKKHKVYRKDIFDLLPDIDVDLAYYDPPYGSNNEKMPPSRVRYSAYYHLWTTVCLNDRPPLFGKVNRRLDTSDTTAGSVFEDFRRGASGRFVVVEAIEELINKTKAKYIVLSYSSSGRATAQEISEVINKGGDLLEVVEIDYKRNVMAEMRWTHEWVKEAESPNREFLFVMAK